jgi:PKD repeat protein
MKRTFFLFLLVLLTLSYNLVADDWTEDFNSVTSNTYNGSSIEISGRTWTKQDAGNFSYANGQMGSYAFTINDDKSGAHITTPVLNTCGTVSFKYAYKSGNSGNVFLLQKSSNGTDFTTLDTRTLGSSANLSYVDYSFAVNDASETLYLRILSDRQNAHLFIEDFTVTSNGSGGTPTVATPVISPADTDFIGNVDVSIACGTEEATIYYTTDGNNPTTASSVYTVPFNITETTTVKAYAVKADHNDSAIAEKTYNKLAIVDVNDIATLRAGTEDGTIYRLTGEAVITYLSDTRNQKFIQDATGAIVIDDNESVITSSYNQYDGITNLIGTLSTYNEMLQIIPQEDPGVATSTANVVSPTVVTITELTNNHESYEAELVTIEDVTFNEIGNFDSGSNYTLSDGSNDYTFYAGYSNADYIGTAIPEMNLNVTGIVSQYNATVRMTSRASSDIEEDGTAPLDVDFSTPNRNIQVGTEITFTDATAGGIAPYLYEWNFGDGSATSDEQHPRHTYANPGTYTVSLLVYDSDFKDKTETKVDYITVTEVVEGVASDLFFSEYIEGSSNNKAIEIYNGTGEDVDLSNYSVKRGSNGNAHGSEIVLSGTLANDAVFILCHNSASQEIKDTADIISSNISHNGNDSYGLYKNGVLIDVIGQEGVDAKWTVGGIANATENHTLVRKSSVTAPTTDWTVSSGEAKSESQWDVKDIDDTSNLGSHSFDGGDQSLPVELSSFTASYTSNANNNYLVTLNWATGSESNLIGYDILRSQVNNLNLADVINPQVIVGNNNPTGASYEYSDDELDGTGNYFYWIKTIEMSNLSEFFGPVVVNVQANNDSEEIVIPIFTTLKSIYPNPFNPSTSVRFYVKEAEQVSIDVYNVKGQLIKNLTSDYFGEGFHDVVWNGRDNNNDNCASGIYFFRMESGSRKQMRKAILVK